MACVLGISAYYHDSAAALVADGHVVAAMQEERFSRKKNDAALPVNAVKACLASAKLLPQDLDRVVYYEDPMARLERVLVSLLRTLPKSWKQIPRALGAQVSSKLWVVDEISSALGVPKSRISVSPHHLSHAASAFLVSPFERAAILTVDGVGEDITTGLWLGEGREIKAVGSIEFPHSLGLFYAALTAYLGFEVNEGEYKVMGLAAFGRPRFMDEFAKLIALQADGSFELAMPYFAFHTDTEIGFGRKLEDLLGPRRAPGKPWSLPESEEDQRYADIAATLQRCTEDALLGLARRARDLTGADHLCLAGGVALNCVANARLLKETNFSRIFVQPAAGDAGGALGAALLGSIELDGRRPVPMVSAALGEGLSNDVTVDLAQRLGIAYSTPNDVLDSAASLLSQGKIVGFARGRFEWGPRALGQRSILAAPQDVQMRERLNRAIKKREPFRPFAPAVLSARASGWFEDVEGDMAPFMTTIGTVRIGRASEIGAVVHVDGTARLQTVTETSSPDLCAVLQKLDTISDVPIAINTSLNGNGEPIVASETDAVAFFASHSIDAMIVGDVLMERARR